jgi:hypothetical protein
MPEMKTKLLALAMAAFGLVACVPDPNFYGPYPYPPNRPPMTGTPVKPKPAPPRPGQQNAAGQFFEAISSYCGMAYEGRVVSDDPEDAGLRRERLVLDIRRCSAREIRMPFFQGTNRSRTWVLARRGGGLSLKHDHRTRSGRPEPMTMYGGETIDGGTPNRQEFPADNYSAELFFQRQRPESAQNIWALEVVPGRFIAYELRRTGRFLRVEFDLTRPLGPQPAAWGQR